MCKPGSLVRNPLECIVPPHVLDHLARQRDPALRELAEAARRTLEITARLRKERSAIREGPAPTAIAAARKARSIHDARGHDRLPGTEVRREGDAPSADPAVNEAYNGLGATYDLFFDAYRRNSIDGRGQTLVASVHYGVRFNNAFWNGRQMVFGDGDGVIFRGFTRSLDVIGHELTHGVTQHEAKLVYSGQPGALNEHVSDVFGSLVKQYHLGQTAEQADWLIGEGLFEPGVKGRALRSMKHPGTAYDDPRLGKDPQPAHMKDYVDTQEDNGGVHINSGIPNRAFCLAALAIGGNAWEKAGAVWYRALTSALDPHATFADAAAATEDIAGHDFGNGVATAVRDAWATVGVVAARSIA